MTYRTVRRLVFTLRASANAITPTLPILLLPKLFNSNKEEYNMKIPFLCAKKMNLAYQSFTYSIVLRLLFTLRASANATAPSISILSPLKLFNGKKHTTSKFNNACDTKEKCEFSIYQYFTYSSVWRLMFTLRASANATAPSSSIWLQPQLLNDKKQRS